MPEKRLPRSLVVTAIALLVGAAVANAHDLFLKPSAFIVPPRSRVELTVLNGTFTSSESAVSRARLRDLAVVSPSARSTGDTAAWKTMGKTTRWTVPVGESGTYVIGASLAPSTIALEGAAFNSYLRSDGLPDVLAERKRKGELGAPARERYSKHVKALVQVGAVRTTSFSAVLGYPAEIVPLDNPYAGERSAESVRVRALVDGKPVTNQVVLAGGRTTRGVVIPERNVRTDAAGIARVTLGTPGVWYVKFIHMVPVASTAGDSVNYESKWATLTFAVR